MPNSTFFQRVSRYASFTGSTRRRPFAMKSSAGIEMTYVGERCSIVTCAAVFAISGTIVTAVAPLPMTTTRLFA